MGRPINAKIFGIPSTNKQLIATFCWLPNTQGGTTNCILTRQVGTNAFYAKDTVSGNAGIVRLVQTVTAPGQVIVQINPYATPTGITASVTPYMQITTYTILNGGTGYTIGDTFSITGQAMNASFTVSKIDTNRRITSLSIVNGGSFSTFPGTTLSLTGGTGTGASIGVTYGLEHIVTNSSSGVNGGAMAIITGAGGKGVYVTPLINSSSHTILNYLYNQSGSGYTSMVAIAFIATGVAENLKRITNNRVFTFEGNNYAWKADGTAPDTTYAYLPLA